MTLAASGSRAAIVGRARSVVAGRAVAERYFTGRPDGLRPSSGEDLVVATT